MITNSKGRGGFSIPMLLIGRRRWQVNGAIRISQPKADTQTKNPKWQDRILTEVEATVRGGLSVYWAGNLGELGGIGGLGIAQIYGHIQLSSLCDCGWGSANICIRGVPWFPRILPGIWKSHCQGFILLGLLYFLHVYNCSINKKPSTSLFFADIRRSECVPNVSSLAHKWRIMRTL